MRSQKYFEELSDLFSNQSQIIELRVGAPPLFGVQFLVDKIREFTKRNPAVRVLVTLSDTHRMMSEILEAKLDIAILDENPDLKRYGEIVTEACYTEELHLYCSSLFHSRNLKARSITPKVLRDLPHIPYHKGRESICKWYMHHFGAVPVQILHDV